MRPTGSQASSQKGRPVRWQLALFAAVLTLPILAFVATLAVRFGAAERARLEAEALDAARAAALAVDRELTGLTATLNLMTLSQSLRNGDLDAFHAQAVEVREKLGVNAVLRDNDGRQVMSARRPRGEPPTTGNMPLQSVAPPPTWPAISNLYQGSLSGEQQFAVELPVQAGPEALYLSLSLPVSRIGQLLIDQRPPAGWVIAVIDRNGVVLARNLRAEQFVGKLATDDLRAHTRGREGSWYGTTQEGDPVLGTYATSALSGWRIAVGVPERALTVALQRSYLLLLLLGLGLAALALALALLFGRRIATPLRQLARQAAALGRGEAVRPVSSGIREVSAIDAALTAAAAALRAREDELRGLNDMLESRVGERTRDLAETNARLIAAATGRERAEAQLRQAQKMEAVGRLTGGVAHDFNNLLTVVLGNLTLVRRRLDTMTALQADPDLQARLLRGIDNAAEGANRAATLTQRLLAFSRQQPLAPEPVDVNRLVEGMTDLLRRTLGEDVAIDCRLAPGLWPAHADRNQLESSLLNLAVNARDAMPGGGRLTITTEDAALDGEDAPAGPYVGIAVADTGTGMTPEVIARAFEPFFTTKPIGKGTGLGLSQVYGFASQSGGHATIQSEAGQGTTITLYLPQLRDLAPPEPEPVEPPPAEPPPSLRKAGLVLVVEDDEMVRDVAVTALQDQGCRTLAAADGPTALRLLAENPKVALLFTDLVLTGPQNGRELAAAALARHPGLKVLFTTGYNRAEAGDAVLEDNFLGKPYTAAELAAKIDQLLD